MKWSRTKLPDVLDLFFCLIDASLGALSPNAWKVVTFVATHVLTAHRDEWRLKHDPQVLLLKDIRKVLAGYGQPPASPHEDPRFEVMAVDSPDAWFPTLWAARLSLTQISRATALSKSSTAAAAREALKLGVLKKAVERSPRLDYMPSLYAIDWNWVQDRAEKLDRRRRYALKKQLRHEVRQRDTGQLLGSPLRGLPIDKDLGPMRQS